MLERVRIGGLSGTYKVRSAELARDKKSQTKAVTVLFLDETTHTFQLEKKAKGSDLLELVFRHLELSERDYFGLQFQPKCATTTTNSNNGSSKRNKNGSGCNNGSTGGSEGTAISLESGRWLDPNKPFRKQWNAVRLSGDISPVLIFRVKFYITDPSRLCEEYTRYQFYLQIKRDIFQGKLPVALNTACLLASYTVQSELGDYNPLEHTHGYLSDLQLLPEQNKDAEHRISELHKLHRGQLPADAEYNYLEHAKRLDMYGIDSHRATDSAGKELSLGVSSIGLLVYQNGIRINTFSWSKMVKVSFKRKDFFIQLRREPSESYDTLLGFNMGAHRNAKSLWKACVEHHSFFRLQRPHRSPRFLPLTLGSKFHYSGRTELQAVQESRQRGKVAKIFIRSPSKRQLAASQPQSPLLNGSGNESTNGTANNKNQLSLLSLTKATRAYDKVTSKTPSIPRKAWEQQSDEPTFIEHCARTYDAQIPTMFDSPPAYNGINNPENSVPKEEGLVTIRLVADDQGRFGFNVKGGVDLNLPVQVSRVAPHTPADKSTPRICEGDQLVMINGRDVSTMMHEQVVNLIRASRQGGELMLTLKPNALVDYTEEEPLYQYVPEESDIVRGELNGDQLFTQSLLLLSDGLASGSLLAQYEQMYRKNADLPITEARKNENLNKNRYRDISPYDCTRVVLLNAESGDYINANYVNMEIPPTGTINRYIATQGPLSTTVNDFWRAYWPSADEEPLALSEGFSIRCLNEKPDETGSFVFRDLVLTDEKTKETRTIQHMQYLAWPDHGVPADPELFLQFTEKVRAARNTTLLQEIEASLKNVKLRTMDENGGLDSSERRIVHTDSDESPNDMPSSTSVHQYISAANPPIIVHCSAGIGRTGVLILMDTALALMETKEPVYPLDIVQAMRDQRACMVQNVSQYRFVCECICAAYRKMVTNEAIEEATTVATKPISVTNGATAPLVSSSDEDSSSPLEEVPNGSSPPRKAPLAVETTSLTTTTTPTTNNVTPTNGNEPATVTTAINGNAPADS
ncbi:hypothetical protein RP20_CCG004101 [Aedes albopictus]|nr:hypothetical protein RP20_CCG004101 [Aedes albopictus]